MDMLIRKKALKIQERLGMRIGLMYGTKNVPVVKNLSQTLRVLEDLYRIGLKAFVLPKELFSHIKTTSDLYKEHYGELLRIKDLAKKYNIELAIHHPTLPNEFEEEIKTYLTIASVMDCRTFIIHPTLYKNIPHGQAKKLVINKLSEILPATRMHTKISIETTGKVTELGSFEDVLDIVTATKGVEPALNWAHIHARGVGALRSEEDFRRIMDKAHTTLGQPFSENAYFFFSGISYGPSGEIKHIPLSHSDIRLEHLIKQIMSYSIKGTLIFEDPEKDKFILKILDDLGNMVR